MSVESLDLQAGPAEAPSLVAELEAHRGLISGYVLKRVRTREDGEDIVQTVFTRALGNVTSFRGECPLSQWLLRIALNELRLYYARVLPRKSRLLPLESFGDFEETVQRTEDEANPSYQQGVVERLLQVASVACTPIERRVITMFYRGESFETIATLLDMRSATVRSHFLRGRANLLGHLVQHEPDLLGGVDAIEAAAGKARVAKELDGREMESLSGPRGGKVFRAACVKLAKYLPAPAIWVLLREVL